MATYSSAIGGIWARWYSETGSRPTSSVMPDGRARVIPAKTLAASATTIGPAPARPRRYATAHRATTLAIVTPSQATIVLMP